MKKFNQTKVGDTINFKGVEYEGIEAYQAGRGFKVIVLDKEGKRLMIYNENPNAMI